MLSLSLKQNLKETLTDDSHTPSPLDRLTLKPVLCEVAIDTKDSKFLTAVKNSGFQQRKFENLTDSGLRRASDQSFSHNSPDSRLKIKKTVILSLNPTEKCGGSESTTDSSEASPKEMIRAIELRKSEEPRDFDLNYPDLEYDNKKFRFHDWKLVSRLVPDFVLPIHPVGIFMRSEDEYFWYFKKDSTVDKPAVSKNSGAMDEEKTRAIIKKAELCLKIEELEREVKGQDQSTARMLDDVKHTLTYRKINENTTSLMVSPSQDLLESLRKLVDYKALNHMKEKEVKVSYSCVKSNFTKNLPKKIGDQFSDYLKRTSNLDMSKVLKDKMSWKVLNAYLDEESTAAGGIVSAKALIQLFSSFVMTYDMSKIDESRTKDDVSKTCYKLAIMNLKAAFEELNRAVDIKTIDMLAVVKSWPLVDIHYRIRVKVVESK